LVDTHAVWEKSNMERKRRTFSAEFKAEAVRLVREEGRTVASVAESLGIWHTSLSKWVEQAEVDAGQGSAGALTSAEKEELTQLRRENRQLKMERDILKKATAFFAKENS
jgi:transposase